MESELSMDDYSIIADIKENRMIVRVWNGSGTQTTSCDIQDFIKEITPELEMFGYCLVKT